MFDGDISKSVQGHNRTVPVFRVFQQPVCDCHRHYGIIRISALGVEQSEIVVLSVVELID